MGNLFPDKIWNYKNFNMGTELDISGEFIYDGIQTLNQMRSIDEDALLFSFLYHVSVGIERLQKIILVLFENVALVDYEKFERSIITHSHTELSERITRITELHLNSRENGFLQLITVFYKTARYHRFNVQSQYSQEQNMVADYIEKHLSQEEIQRHFITKRILVNNDVKKLFGKVIGSISKEYYRLVREGCARNNTFTYELRTDSKAERVFLPHHRDNSLQEQKNTESIVLKELLVYLRNTKQSNAFMRFIESIQPLELDLGCLNEYFQELSKGVVSQSLIDEVEYLYGENAYSIDRISQVDLIGDTNVLFEYQDIDDCIQMLNSFTNGKYSAEKFAIEFPKMLEVLEDDCIHGILDDVAKLCNKFLDRAISQQDFKQKVMPYRTAISGFFNY